MGWSRSLLEPPRGRNPSLSAEPPAKWASAYALGWIWLFGQGRRPASPLGYSAAAIDSASLPARFFKSGLFEKIS
jgi:hypothetical protein